MMTDADWQAMIARTIALDAKIQSAPKCPTCGRPILENA